MIKKIVIKNYKIFRDFELELNDSFNILVGDNEAGKSTILEAIYAALTKRLNGRMIELELSPYIFNTQAAEQYIKSVKDGKPLAPPEILIELYLEEADNLSSLRGSMNSHKEDCVGVKLEIAFDEDYKEEYNTLLGDPSKFERVNFKRCGN